MERRLFSDDDVARIYQGAVRVLGQMGIRVENRACLEAMERFGARVDYARERAIVTPEVIQRSVELARAQNPGWQRHFAHARQGYSSGGDGACPFYYQEDVDRGRSGADRGSSGGGPRRATESDCVEALKIVEACGVTGTTPPVLNSDVRAGYQAIRVLELGIATLSRTELHGTDLFYPEQVPFVAELGRLYRDDPGWFLSTANCITSPLTIGRTIADLAVAKAAYSGVPYVAPPMPVMGANAPLSAAGTAVVGVAEILGSYVLAKALNPGTQVWALSLCSLMDMRSGDIVFCGPEVLAADLAICETMECYLGLPCNAYGGYCDAKLPGVQAIEDKLFRCLGLALYSQLTGFSGALDQGKVFSPTQMVFDQDMHSFLAHTVRPHSVDDEALAVEEIIAIGWEAPGYLRHAHTRKRMRSVWRSKVFDRVRLGPGVGPAEGERELLDQAQQIWREALGRYEPPNHDDVFLRELRSISVRARAALA